ncbi:hypothetical protein PBRA_009163 [Plasmodiophora brassicae]|uniref:Uncharacterized protein n=1 Tax=Plasmodiophora brassicae TaxID=37360 RepID=A0A0G4J5U1_PLABS|nr:hypothetical protein PBRA_009163 [Plasmodiophora brassicae]
MPVLTKKEHQYLEGVVGMGWMRSTHSVRKLLGTCLTWIWPLGVMYAGTSIHINTVWQLTFYRSPRRRRRLNGRTPKRALNLTINACRYRHRCFVLRCVRVHGRGPVSSKFP